MAQQYLWQSVYDSTSTIHTQSRRAFLVKLLQHKEHLICAKLVKNVELNINNIIAQ